MLRAALPALSVLSVLSVLGLLVSGCGGVDETFELRGFVPQDEVHHCRLTQLELPTDGARVYLQQSPCGAPDARWRFAPGADYIELLNENSFLDWGADEQGLWLSVADPAAPQTSEPFNLAYRYISSETFVGAIRIIFMPD